MSATPTSSPSCTRLRHLPTTASCWSTSTDPSCSTSSIRTRSTRNLANPTYDKYGVNCARLSGGCIASPLSIATSNLRVSPLSPPVLWVAADTSPRYPIDRGSKHHRRVVLGAIGKTYRFWVVTIRGPGQSMVNHPLWFRILRCPRDSYGGSIRWA